MADVDSQVIKSYLPGDPSGTGAFQEELKNQQLNDALNSGTVDAILMKTGYGAIYDHHVVIKKDLVGFTTSQEVQIIVDQTTVYDFGDYNSTKRLYVKSNIDPTQKQAPTLAHFGRRGEMAVDNFDGSLYTLKRNAENTADEVTKIDAGTVNGYTIETNIIAAEYLNSTEIKVLINSLFTYDAATNSLTISAV